LRSIATEEMKSGVLRSCSRSSVFKIIMQNAKLVVEQEKIRDRGFGPVSDR